MAGNDTLILRQEIDEDANKVIPAGVSWGLQPKVNTELVFSHLY